MQFLLVGIDEVYIVAEILLHNRQLKQMLVKKRKEENKNEKINSSVGWFIGFTNGICS